MPTDDPRAWVPRAEASCVLPHGLTSMVAELLALVSTVAFIAWAAGMGVVSTGCWTGLGEALLRAAAKPGVWLMRGDRAPQPTQRAEALKI